MIAVTKRLGHAYLTSVRKVVVVIGSVELLQSNFVPLTQSLVVMCGSFQVMKSERFIFDFILGYQHQCICVCRNLNFLFLNA